MSSILKTRLHLDNVVALLWAALASLLELAPILDALERGQGLVIVLFFGLAYQFGNGLSRWVPTRVWIISLLAVGGLISYVMAGQKVVFQTAGVCAISVALQLCRRATVEKGRAPRIGTAIKRVARVVGFACSALVPTDFALACIVASCFTVTAFQRRQPTRQLYVRLDSTGSTMHPLLLLMVIHQAHYFTYAYAVVFLLFSLSGGGTVATATLFAFGWITYLAAERLWSCLPDKLVFVCGHIFVTLCLAGIAVSGANLSVTTTLWILTGFGGGSVYCLSRLSRAASISEHDMTFWEDVGHVVGAMLALLLVLLWSFSANSLAGVGALLALVAALVMLRGAGPGRRI